MYEQAIIDMLGESRYASFCERLDSIRMLADATPDRSSRIIHLHIPLEARNDSEATRELKSRLAASGDDWFFLTASQEDGRWYGLASNLFQSTALSSRIKATQFLCFDLHSRLYTWRLSHVWRAADLAVAVHTLLGRWLVIPTASSARAFLEGVAAFYVEGERMLEEWVAFKAAGPPNLEQVGAYRKQLQRMLQQAEFASRLTESSGMSKSPIERTNVMTFVQKFAKRWGESVNRSYAWLCDAVHPSFGSQTTYVATQGIHLTGASFATELARQPHLAQVRIEKIAPTVAHEAADAFILAANAFLITARRMNWLVEDFRLTTGVPSLFEEEPREEASLCSCGSGIARGGCKHAWGGNTAQPIDGKSSP